MVRLRLQWKMTRRRSVLLVMGLLLFAVVGVHIIPSTPHPIAVPTWGVTFVPSHARYLGLNWKSVYSALLDDLGVRWLRIEVPWDEIERTPGTFDLGDVRWQLDEAQKRGARVLVAIGRKLPRWPECRSPSWAQNLSAEEQEVRILSMLRSVVEDLHAHPAIWAWQVENEPLLWFGECPRPNAGFYRQEIALVRSLDSHPIVGTASGELSTWWRMAGLVDMLGVSMYRVAYNPILGYIHYPVVPALYARKAWLVSGRVPKIFSSEVQMEPWAPSDIRTLPIEEQFRSFSIDDFDENIQYVRDTGFDTFYLWGVEWWAWMKETKNHPEFWEAAKRLYHQ